MDPITVSLLAVLFSIFAYVIYYAHKVNRYFEERGIPYEKPWLFVGNALPVFLLRITLGERHKQVCDKFPDAPLVGYYDFMNPTCLVQDAQLAEKIMIKDFVHFMDRGFPVDEDRNPLDSNLFTMTGKRWKACRNKLSPIFTTGKLKGMYDTMTLSGDELVKVLSDKDEVELREVLASFAMDVIGSCAFGIESGSLNKPDSEFLRMAKKIAVRDVWQFVKLLLIRNCPPVAKFLNISFNKPDVTKYFCNIIRDTVKYRRENGYVRNDFVQLMMQLQDKGYVEVHTKDPADDYLNIDHISYSTEKFELTNEQITGQAFTFLTAGFEATALSLTYTLYELSKQPQFQEKTREEVFREVKRVGSLSYDAIKGMNYMEQCIHEAMRKYPAVSGLSRVCTQDYTLPNGVKILVGDIVVICVNCIHYNTKYYSEPDVYKPERFDPDKIYEACSFLPFGNGPRVCIAMRFAMLQIKYTLAKLLMNYRFTVSPKTKEPLTIDVKSFFTAPTETVLFNVTKITGNSTP